MVLWKVLAKTEFLLNKISTNFETVILFLICYKIYIKLNSCIPSYIVGLICNYIYKEKKHSLSFIFSICN